MVTKSKFAQPIPPAAIKAPRTKRVATAPEAAEPIVTHADHTPLDDLRAAWDKYTAWVQQPTWARRLTSVALGLLTYGGVFYLSMQLVDVFVAGTMLYTGVGFISFMAAFLGICAALVAATTAGMYVYELAMAFEASRVRDRFNAFTDSVKARFISQPVEA